ncbi:MAG: site-specific integrase [Candidatus Bathyarchaeota archaeon]|nr:site-specific integrase [Candidatus Bathyarchaeota archaeon]
MNAAYISDVGNVKLVSHISLTLTDPDTQLLRKLYLKINNTVKSLQHGKNVAAAHAWFHVATGRQPKIMRRSDFYKIMALPKPPREQVACMLGMMQGFRSGEVLVSKTEHFDLDAGVVYVFDVKDKKYYPQPLHRDTAYSFLKIDQNDGYVLQRHRRFRAYGDKPVSRVHWNNMIKRWARDVGALDWQSFHPTLLRAFFAKEWVRPRPDSKRGGDIVLLSKIMRHHDPFTTWLYMQQFIYLEDLQAEMERMYQPPVELDRIVNIEK